MEPDPIELKERSRTLTVLFPLSAFARSIAPLERILFQCSCTVSSNSVFSMKEARILAPASVTKFLDTFKSLRVLIRPEKSSSSSSSASAETVFLKFFFFSAVLSFLVRAVAAAFSLLRVL